MRLVGVLAIARLAAAACGGGVGGGSTASHTVIGLPSMNLRTGELTGAVALAEELGVDAYVRVQLADEGRPVAVGVGGRRPPRPEQEVGLTADSQDVFTFRSKTGDRIVC